MLWGHHPNRSNRVYTGLWPFVEIMSQEGSAFYDYSIIRLIISHVQKRRKLMRLLGKIGQSLLFISVLM